MMDNTHFVVKVRVSPEELKNLVKVQERPKLLLGVNDDYDPAARKVDVPFDDIDFYNLNLKINYDMGFDVHCMALECTENQPEFSVTVIDFYGLLDEFVDDIMWTADFSNDFEVNLYIDLERLREQYDNRYKRNWLVSGTQLYVDIEVAFLQEVTLEIDGTVSSY
jgi:hypothetical protein